MPRFKYTSMRKLLGALYITYGLVVFFAVMFLMLPFIILTSFIPNKYGATIPFFFLRVWAHSFSILTLFFYKVIGREKIDKTKPYIYVANHGSYLDATSVVIATPSAFKPLGKIEMAKIPFFGFIYKRVVITVDRSTKESRSASVEKLKEVLKKGISILLFPEGTMNRTPNHLKEFYDGAFRIAIETQTPIAPFVVINARNLMPRNNPLLIKPGVMKIVFSDPVEVSAYTLDNLEQLKQKVYSIMEDLIIKNQ